MVALSPRTGTFPGAVDVSQRPITFATDGTLGVDRFAHAKLFLLEGEKADHLVEGSPNASWAALGGPGITARNAEASVYRRLTPGSVRHALKLTLDQVVSRAAVHSAPTTTFQEGAHHVPSEMVEIEGRELTWWPAPSCSAAGAALVMGSVAIPIKLGGNGQGRAELPTRSVLPLIVHFVLVDGRQTLPVIMHDNDRLREASPGSYGPLSKLIGNFENGSSNLLDLAAAADFLFPLPGVLKTPGAVVTGRRLTKSMRLSLKARKTFAAQSNCLMGLDGSRPPAPTIR